MTDLTQLTRKHDRGSRLRGRLDELLDEALVGTLSSVLDGRPWAIPTFFARDGDSVILHGSTGAGMLRHLAAGAPVVFSVFALDALVVAHTAFDSSANYRSATIRGTVEVLDGAAADRAMRALTEHLIPGRTSEVPANTGKELAATIAMVLPIESDNWLFKSRTGSSGPPEEPTEAWAGVVPLHTVAAEPVVDEWVPDERPMPQSVRRMLEATDPG